MVADGNGYGGMEGTVNLIADGVTRFAGRPGATVRVIAKASADWQRYARRVGNTFTDTTALSETLRRALPGLDRGSSWGSQRAAVDALAHPDATYAVVAEAGDNGPLTVVTFKRTADELTVVGGGTTFPQVRAEILADASLPSAEQAGLAAQYALASIAAQETLGVSHDIPSGTWHGPRTFEPRRMILAGGQSRAVPVTTPTWSADDVRQITTEVSLRQADGRHPFPQLESPLGGELTYRRLATELKTWIDRGGTLAVLDHSDADQADQAGVAMMALVSNVDALAENPITQPGAGPDAERPLAPGVRTMVAMVGDQPRALITTGRNVAGDLHVLRYLSPGDVGAARAIVIALDTEAGRIGGPVSFSRAGAVEYSGKDEFAISATDASWHLREVRRQLRKVDQHCDERLTEVLQALEPAVQPTADPAALAESVHNFRAAGGHVLVLAPSEPRFLALQEKTAALWAAAMNADGTVDPGIEGMWRAFNPPRTDRSGLSTHAIEEPLVAIAVRDDEPLAAVGLRLTGARLELGPMGAVPDADEALTSAVVDGAYSRATSGRPVVMFVPADEAAAEQFGTFGMQVSGAVPLDDDSRVEVRLPESSRAAIYAANHQGWITSHGIDLIAGSLTRFQQENGSVTRLDHGVEADRRAVDDAAQAVRKTIEDAAEYLPARAARASAARAEAADRPMPAVNGSRVTVVAEANEGQPAFITFDETPEGSVQVVDLRVSDMGYTSRDVVRYWFSDYLAERGLSAEFADRIGDSERKNGPWAPDESRYLLTGVRTRLGDGPAELLRPSVPAPESAATPESASAPKSASGVEQPSPQGPSDRHRPGGNGRGRGAIER